MKAVSIAEAKNHLPSLIHEVEEGKVVELTRHGHPVAVIFSILDYKKLKVFKNFSDSLSEFREQNRQFLLGNDDYENFNKREKDTGRNVEIF